MKRKHILLINIGLILFGTILGLAIVEVSLRLVGYSAPVFREPNAILGWRGTANLEGSHRIENVTYNKFNSQGYHDREHSKAKPHGTFRIAVVGDSFVQGSEVTLDKHFTTIMARIINGRLTHLNRKVEVINFGVSGFSTAQELILLRNEVSEYRPDLVILMVYPGNDIIDNSYELTTTLRNMRPYFVLNTDQSLARKPGYPDPDKILINSILIKLINLSRLLQFAKEALKRAALNQITVSGQMETKKREDDVFLDHPSKLWKQAWNLTEKLLTEFAKETSASGVDFLMAIAGIPIQVHPMETVRKQFMATLDLRTLDYPTLRLSKFAQRSGIPYISLVKPFFDLASTGVYLHGFEKHSLGNGHWNAKGHYLVAELLAGRVLATINSK